MLVFHDDALETMTLDATADSALFVFTNLSASARLARQSLNDVRFCVYQAWLADLVVPNYAITCDES